MTRAAKIIISCALISLLLGWSLYLLTSKREQPLLTEADVRLLLENKYSGTVSQVELVSSRQAATYVAAISNQHGTYHVSVNGHDGTIEQLTRKSSTNEPPNRPTDKKDEAMPDQSVHITKEAAKTIALTRFKGTVQSVEINTDKNGTQVYVVQLESSTMRAVVKINRRDGKIIHITRSSKQSDESKQPNKPTRLTSDQAKKIALAKVKGIVSSIELEDEDGTLVYEVEITAANKEEVTVYVNAYSGEIAAVKWED
ncbi:PepSY domain-containing protein [Paenibacillus sp. UMB4589-SE434]|uniref:PepSY domain-containing protein n=1 Tax=Paenibacillus sp. UMB4589-SE434 TaxID=3046314 RepID=UPI00254DA32C|nr:PepSY domain-containing protein [Paenibacillus sp. UMB4589-SE434]